MFDEAYDDIQASVMADKGRMPPCDDAFDAFIDALQSDEVVVERVNSDNDVMNLLDANAELKLRTPYNIWVGGNILDRGITIPNLIAFYYGRNPKTMQADTVLQHSRMYGNRDPHDLAVTRFYTSRAVYDRLSFAIDGPPKIDQPAIDLQIDFIQMPRCVRLRPAFAKIGRDFGSKVNDPSSHGLIGHHDATFRQQIFHVAEAQGEPKIQPNRLLDDLGRKAVAAVIYLRHGQWLSVGPRDRKPRTM